MKSIQQKGGQNWNYLLSTKNPRSFCIISLDKNYLAVTQRRAGVRTRKIQYSKREREAGCRDPHSRASTPAESWMRLRSWVTALCMGLAGRDAEASSRREASGLGKETGRAVLGTSTQTHKPQVPLWVLVSHSSDRMEKNSILLFILL